MIPNDIDIETGRLHEIANGLANARKAGHCSHEKREMRVLFVQQGDNGGSDGEKTACLDCGKVGTWAELDEDRKEILIEWT